MTQLPNLAARISKHAPKSLLLLGGVFLAAGAHANPPTTLYYFPTVSSGIVPYAPVIVLPSGDLVGTTASGGKKGCNTIESPPGCGTVFMLSPGSVAGTWDEKPIHKFEPKTGDGAGPVAPVIADSAGNLYGTTASGGTCTFSKHGCGTVFKLSPPAAGSKTWTETVLYTFSGHPDGSQPQAGLVLDRTGTLYGTTAAGGMNGGGTAFSLTPGAGGTYTETVLVSFDSTTGSPIAPLLLGPAGTLYGATSSSGSPTAEVFQLFRPKGNGDDWTKVTIYSFPSANQLNYVAGLSADNAGNLYGTNAYGGNFTSCFQPTYGCGIVFRLKPPAVGVTNWVETDLHVFAGGSTDGANPFGGVLVGSTGILTGTTVNGGTASGTAFQLRPGTGDTYTALVIAQFSGPHHGGSAPKTALVENAGLFYGTTDESVGSASPPYGTVYSVKP